MTTSVSDGAPDPYRYADQPCIWGKYHGHVRSYVIPQALEKASPEELQQFLLEGDPDDRVGVLIDICLCSDWPVSKLLRCFFRVRRAEPQVFKHHFNDIFTLLDGHLCDVLQRCDVALWMDNPHQP